MKKLLTLLLAMAMIVGLFAGCGPTNSSNSALTDVSANSGENDHTEKEPTVLTIASDYTEAFIRNFNPFNPTAYTFVRGFMYEYLVLFDMLNGYEEHMWLAEDVISEPDNKTLTIKVRPGILWSDGEELDAEDVAYSYTIYKDHPEIDFYGIWGDNPKLEDVKVIDKYTVKVVGAYPNTSNRLDLIMQLHIIPYHIWSKIDNPATYVMETPVVTGAFSEIVEFTPEMVVLGRNPHYWKADELKVDRLRIPQYSGPDGFMSVMQSGIIDWAGGFIPNIDDTYVQGDPHRKYYNPPCEGVRIAFNYMTKNEGLQKAIKDPKFKMALSLSIDRKAIIESACFGLPNDMVPTVTGLPPALRGYMNPEAQKITDKYTGYDSKGAKQILAEAGYKDVDGDGFVENPDGSHLEFSILTPSGWVDWNDGCAIAVQCMQDIGVNAHAVTADASLVYESWGTGAHDALYTANGVASGLAKFYFDTIGDQSRVLTQSWWSICQTNYVNDELTELIGGAFLANEEKLHEIANKVEMHFAENMINIPLYYSVGYFSYNDSRFTGWTNEENPFVWPCLNVPDSKILQLLALEPVK